MDYIGSKRKLNEWIFGVVENSFPTNKQLVFLDACCGSGIVSQYAAAKGYNVISNDLMTFSSVIVNGSIGLTDSQQNIALKYIGDLNRLPGIKGYFYNNFCNKSNPPRLYFTEENALLIDHIRQEIEKIEDSKIKNYLLYCGLEAISRINNTAGVQPAFLKKFKDRSREKILLRQEKVYRGKAIGYCSDILKLLSDENFREKNKEDILYLDPPYNQRQYGPNYHLYETFIRNDNPMPRGLTGLRNWKEECSSLFCSKKSCLSFLKDIISLTTAKTVIISYNSDGLLTAKEIKSNFSNVKIHKREQRRYKSDNSKNRDYNQKELVEYLFEIRL